MGGKKKKGSPRRTRVTRMTEAEEPIPLAGQLPPVGFRMLNWKFMNFGRDSRSLQIYSRSKNCLQAPWARGGHEDLHRCVF